MLKRICLLAVPAVLLCSGETIDRIAVTVGRRAITESALLLEIRLTAFLNREQPDLSVANKRRAAERMVEQMLIRNEMELSQYPMPDPSDADPLLEQVKKEAFSGDSSYRKALDDYRITEKELKEYLLRQAYTLRFIDIRFRPGVQVLVPEIREYYEKRFLPEWQNKNKSGTPTPSLEDVHDRIEEVLTGERVDQVVENWLEETRARTRIVFSEKAFQ
jgi:hypothetical protein